MAHYNDVRPVPASLIGYALTLPFAYVGHRMHTFNSHNRIVPEARRFALATLFSIIVTLGTMFLLAEVLGSLGVDEQCGVAWLTMGAGSLERHSVRSEDLDGVVEHARSIAGTRMAIFFRDLGYGKVKISFRSTGDVDVNQFARRFGGGGHVKASGALVAGTLDEVRDRVVSDAKDFLGCGPTGR